jgi:hypothetical protein
MFDLHRQHHQIFLLLSRLWQGCSPRYAVSTALRESMSPTDTLCFSTPVLACIMSRLCIPLQHFSWIDVEATGPLCNIYGTKFVDIDWDQASEIHHHTCTSCHLLRVHTRVKTIV